MPGALLSARELVRLQRQAEASMTEPCSILDPTAPVAVGDGYGGKVRAGAAPVVATTVCRVSPAATEQERLIADQLKAREFVVVALPIVTAMDLKYVLEIRGKRYEVLALVPIQTYAVERRVVARAG